MIDIYSHFLNDPLHILISLSLSLSNFGLLISSLLTVRVVLATHINETALTLRE